MNRLFYLFLSLCLFSTEQWAKSKQPNIISIIMDDADYLDFSCFGGPKGLTPNIDRLASRGVRFTQAYTTASACTPSRHSLLTGKYGTRYFDEHQPAKHRNAVANVQWNTHINSPTPTLATALKEVGYVTGISGKWHISSMEVYGFKKIDKTLPLDHPEVGPYLAEHQRKTQAAIERIAGFDEARAVLPGNFDGLEGPPLEALKYHHLEWITQGCTDFIDSHKDRPFYFAMYPTVIHGPVISKSLRRPLSATPEGHRPELERFKGDREQVFKQLKAIGSKDHYRHSGMLWLDQQVKRIVDCLEKNNILDNTIIVIAPDHNIEPGKATVYEKGGRIPMIFSWQDHFDIDQQSDLMVQLVDLLPTFREAAGAPLSKAELAKRRLDGQSFLSAIRGDTSAKQRQEVYSEFGYTRAIRANIQGQDYKYIAWRFPKAIVNKMIKQTGFHSDSPLSFEDIRSRAHDDKFRAPNHLNMASAQQPKFTANLYPSYFARDQLYRLDDSAEQHNLADNPEHSHTLSELKAILKTTTQRFDHHFDVDGHDSDPSGFMESEQYRAMVLNAIEHVKKTSTAPYWYSGKPWPPELETQFPNHQSWPPQLPPKAQR